MDADTIRDCVLDECFRDDGTEATSRDSPLTAALAKLYVTALDTDVPEYAWRLRILARLDAVTALLEEADHE